MEAAKDLSEVKAHPIWRGLTAKQQLFVERYILSDGNRDEALVGYAMTTRNKAAYASKLLNHSKIKALLAFYYGSEVGVGTLSRKEFLELVSDRLRKTGLDDSWFYRLSDLYASLKGWTGGKAKAKDDDMLNKLARELEKQSGDKHE